MTAPVQRWTLRIAGFAGLAVFTFFFALSFSVPRWVEEFAADHITARVAERVDAQLGSSLASAGAALPEMARRLLERNSSQAEKLRARVDAMLAEALIEIRDPDCACRMRALLASASIGEPSSTPTQQQLRFLIHGTYLRVVADLKHEIRIFTAVNAGAFALLLLVSFAKPGAARHLFVPGLLLAVATVFCTWLYVFEQNWLLTIVEGSYMGWAYAGWLGVAYLFLCDIALNRGLVTTSLVNAVIEVFGSAISSLTPC
jgi:hypothetical protein